MPADRPRIMLFSPIRGKKCNTKMYIVYVWKETKNPRYRLTAKKTPGTDSATCPAAFPKRYWVPQVPANVSRSSTLCPGLRSAGIASGRSFHFHQPSTVPTGDFSICPWSMRWFCSLLVPCRAPRAESVSHITLCWVMQEEGGQEVVWYDSYCALETRAGRLISFPVYLFTSSFPVTVQGTSMFREM